MHMVDVCVYLYMNIIVYKLCHLKYNLTANITQCSSCTDVTAKALN